jgi:hypothetical protein
MTDEITVERLINQAMTLSERLMLLISNDRAHVNRTDRDALCLMHWSLIFEHHQGILLLLQHHYHASAFALLRPFEEAFARSAVVMFGTAKQAAAIWNGTYKTDFEAIGKQINKRLKQEAHFGAWFKDRINMMHGFTHGGKEQLVRLAQGSDIISSYTEKEIRALVLETLTIAFLAAIFTTEFLGYESELRSVAAMVDEARPIMEGYSRKTDRKGMEPKVY